MKECSSMWLELRELTSAGRANVYRRAQLVVALSKSEEFLQQHQNDSGLVYDALRPHFEDMFLEPRDLEALLEFAPDESAWKVASLKQLWAKCISQSRRQTAQTTENHVTREDKLRAKIAELQAEVLNLKRELRDARSRLRRIERTMELSHR